LLSTETNVRRVFPHLILLLLTARSASAHPAWGIVVDPQGRVVFSEVTTNSVWRLENDGRLVKLVTGRHSHEISLDGQGTLHGEHVVYDQGRWLRSLWSLNPAGRVETKAAGEPPKPAGLAAVNARVRGPEGALYVTDGQAVRRIDPDGQVVTLGGDPLAGVSHGEHPRLLGLAVRNGSVLVADADHGVVLEITPGGEVVDRWRSGPLWAPAGIAVSDGNIYLLESRPENLLMLLERIGPWARVRRWRGGELETIAVAGGWGKSVMVGVALAGLALALLRRLESRAERLLR
jgi:streptogramin lyase